MTFKDKLIDISNTVDLEVFIAKHCTAIQNKLENAAKAGYRTFQIAAVRLHTPSVAFNETTAENCYDIVSASRPDKMALLLNKVKDYLYKLGFSPNDIQQISISNDLYTTVVLKVEW
jgi:hypothetical protein